MEVEGRRGRARRLSPTVPFAAEQTADLDLRLSRAGDPFEFSVRLCWRLRSLVERRVPARCLEAGPVPRAARLRFADSTTVIVKAAVPGELARLAVAMRRASATPLACSTSPDGETTLVLAWPGLRKGLLLQVVGLDQPD